MKSANRSFAYINSLLHRLDADLRAQSVGRYLDAIAFEIFALLSDGAAEPDWHSYALGTSYYRSRVVIMKGWQ